MQTPYILVNKSKMIKNLDDMYSKILANNCTIRPHVKTHKIPEFAKMQIAHGAKGITVAKVGEAEVMAEASIDDIFIAYPIVGNQKLDRVIALKKKIKRLIMCADSYAVAKMLSDKAIENNVVIELRLEIDTGMHRTGIIMDNIEAVAQKINALKGVDVTGIFTFKANNYKGQPTNDLELAGHEEGEIMTKLADKLCSLGLNIIDISGGSTPTGVYVSNVKGMTEIRPGTNIFYDAMGVFNKMVTIDECAAHVVYTVVSINNKGRMIIDGGAKSISTDTPLNKPPFNFDSYGICVQDPYVKLSSMNEEHGIIELLDGAKKYKVGDKISFISNHICTTVNLYDFLYLDDGNQLIKYDIAARGKLV